MWLAELCSCIEDGIRRLADSPFGLYIPDFDWDRVAARLGRSPVFEHLLNDKRPQAAIVDSDATIDKLIMDQLDIQVGDFSPAVPLTSYGLDSLSAARLSTALRPFLAITQMQLLADVSVIDIRAKMEERDPSATDSNGPPTGIGLIRPVARSTGFDWKSFNQPGETIIKILDTKDQEAVPLILIHGTSGNGGAFYPLEEAFTTPLWMVQTTPETPTDSMASLVDHYHRQIKAARPVGPYRFGVFCATSPIGVELVRKFEGDGDTVLQLAFLDHFPSLFCEPGGALDLQTLRTGAMSAEYLASGMDMLLKMYERDATASRRRMKDELHAAFLGAPVRAPIQAYYDNFVALLRMLVGYMLALVPTDASDKDDGGMFAVALREALARRMRGIRAPLKVYVAGCGMVVGYGGERQWAEFGVKEGDVVEVPGGHFAMFQQESLARELERGWC
jgi:thioesterase domain-containing protein